jgi:hypothetical protein
MRSILEGKMEFEYHFFPSHIAIKVIKTSDIFAFHFQGLIGGEAEASPKDYVVLKDGQKRDVSTQMGLLSGTGITGKQLPSPFLYMVDSDAKKTQVFYMGAKNLPATHEDEAWLATCPDKAPIIQVFSFGRKPGSYSGYTLSGTEPIFIFGFQPKAAGHETISAAIDARLADPFNPASGGTTSGTGGSAGPGDAGVSATGGAGGKAGSGTGQGGGTGPTSSSTGGAPGTGGGSGQSAGSGGAGVGSGGTTVANGGSGGAVNGGTTGTPATGGSSAGSGGTSNAAGGSSASGGITSGGAGSGGQSSTMTGGSTGQAASSSGACSIGHEDGDGGLGLPFALGIAALGLCIKRRRRSRKDSV